MNGTIADVIARFVTGRHWTQRRTGHGRLPPRDEIAALAYRLYEARGWQTGDDLEDWLLAERALMQYSAWGHREIVRRLCS
jgi:hypothetical protein